MDELIEQCATCGRAIDLTKGYVALNKNIEAMEGDAITVTDSVALAVFCCHDCCKQALQSLPFDTGL